MADEKFLVVEQDLQRQLNRTKAKLKSADTASIEKRKQLIVSCEEDLEQLNKFVGQLESVARNYTQAVRNTVQPRVDNYNRELFKLRQEVLTALPESTSLMSRSPNYDSIAADNQARIVDGTQRLEKTSSRMQDMQSVCQNTEEIGVSTLGELESQHNQLERISYGIDEVDDNVTRAKRVLNRIWRDLMTSMFVQAAIVIVLVLCILAVIFFKWCLPPILNATK
eukprot:TRINITY_DN5060_c0_g1_i1.p1 TRINITY_DN5060_c0_g1~~TRINITY_DN5060_c0_g1_i1.p1  ORF type:complete len:224 (-),score=87.27 TRINITY_DN5060_c0_g1_i1:151-822(-)